ncbi:MAG TPA: cobalamin-binding protein [Candidatus Binatia bacterium]|jgi:iron complex transport system substrate-binding protein|nr:cobalamin-binding protein [Candidatus Binatia bacterium]
MNYLTRASAKHFFLCLLALLLGREAFANESQALATKAIPMRIVSLAPSVTETLFALGFGNRVVGVTTYCDYPVAALRLPKIGGFTNPSLEAIVAQRPDLVIGVNDSSHPVKAREMERLGIKVALIAVTNVNEILNSIKSVARLLGSPKAGERLVQKITLQFDEVKKRVAPAPRRATLLVVGLRPLVAVGGKNFIDELITLAGGENIAGNAAQPWLNLPDEYVVAKAPQVIIEAGMGSERGQIARHWGDLKSIPAVKEHRVYAYPSDKILRPGPRIGEGLEEIARLVHPECFADSKGGLNKGSGCEGS